MCFPDASVLGNRQFGVGSMLKRIEGVLAAVGLIFAYAAAWAQTFPELAGPVVVELDLSAVRPTVELKLGEGPAWPAVMDTGAVKTVVNLNRAKEVGFDNEGKLEAPFDRMSANGFQTTIRSASIKGVPLPDISVPAIPLPLPDHVAILSPGIFTGKFVSFDFAKAKMTIHEKVPDAAPSGEQYEYSAPPLALPTIPVTIGSETLHAHLDTGSAYGLIFPLSFAEVMPLVEPLEESGQAAGHSSTRKLYRSRIDGAVQIGPITVQDPEVLFTEVVPYVNVGMRYLQRFRITLDPEEQRLWVEMI